MKALDWLASKLGRVIESEHFVPALVLAAALLTLGLVWTKGG